MNQWYAVHTKARQEAVAARELGNQAFRTFLPLIRSARHFRGRWQAVNQPLFPGYLFVELDAARQSTAPIRSTRGAIGLVRCGEHPLAVPAELIDQLMAAQVDGQPIDPDALFKAGDHVRLVEGPMTGIEAVFLARSGAERVVLLLELLGRRTEVTTSAHHIAPAR